MRSKNAGPIERGPTDSSTDASRGQDSDRGGDATGEQDTSQDQTGPGGTLEGETAASDQSVVTDGGQEFYVVDELEHNIEAGPYPTRIEATKTVTSPGEIIVSDRALDFIRNEHPLRDTRDETDVLADGGKKTANASDTRRRQSTGSMARVSVRLPIELEEDVDHRVDRGPYATRSELLREAVRRQLAGQQRDRRDA